MENPRNKIIFEGAAEAFVDALVQFCSHPILQYQWTKYIPEDDENANPFWSELWTRINESIKTKAVLWPQSRSGLRLISQLKIVPDDLMDSDGQPLVPDLPHEGELYLDLQYSTTQHKASPKLKTLGLSVMNIHECIDRIGSYATSSTSKMKSADDD